MRRIPITRPAGLLERAPGEEVELPQEAAHYARDVLRLRPGEHVELFDGSGRCVVAELSCCDALRVAARVILVRQDDALESPLRITLAQAIPKGERWEWILEKSVELGVSIIQPVLSARVVVKLDAQRADSKRTRWERIVEGAARQCQRSIIPQVRDAAALRTLLDAMHAPDAGDMLHLVATPHHSATPLDVALAQRAPGSSVTLWIGPEGGWSEEEVAALLARGARAMSLGPRILRAETAALTALAITQHLAGDLS